jgi:two-component system response regulator MprA
MATRAARRRILVVDDEAQLRSTVADALALEGYEVSTATNGADALSIIPLVHPDAIVFDLWMPVLDGWEFRKAQLASHPGIPVIVLSALDPHSERLAELHADMVLPKPFDLDDLYLAVATVLGTNVPAARPGARPPA